MTKNVCMMVSCQVCKYDHFSMHNFCASHPFNTDSQEVTSDQCSPPQSGAQLIQTLVHLCMS